MTFGKLLLSSYAWTLGGQWASRGLGIVSTLVLLRLLSPDDFGLAALCVLVIMLFQQLSATGQNAYLLRLKKVDDYQLDTAWTLQFLFKSTATIIVLSCSWLIADIAGDQRLFPVLLVAGFTPLITALQNPASLLFEKNMRYDLITKIQVFSRIISISISLIVAYFYQNYWALIIGSLLFVTINSLATYIVTPRLPKFTLKNMRDQLNYSSNILLIGVLGYIRSKVDLVVVNSRYSTTGVGLWNVGQEFALLPLTEIVTPMAGPLFSGLARYKDQLSELSDKILKYLSTVYLILIPSAVGMMLLSHQFVLVVMGDKWTEAEIIIQTLCWLMPLFVTINSINIIYKIQAYFKMAYFIESLGLVLVVGAFFYPYDYTIGEFSVYRLGVGVLVAMVAVSSMFIFLKVNSIDYFKVLVIPSTASLIMVFFVNLSCSVFNDNILFDFLVNVMVGVLVYSLMVFLMITLLRKYFSIWEYNYSIMFLIINKILVLSKLKSA